MPYWISFSLEKAELVPQEHMETQPLRENLPILNFDTVIATATTIIH
jgi:hypothetical protein